MHLQVVGFMDAPFTEDHGEIMNPGAAECVRAPDPMLPLFLTVLII